MVAAAAGVSPGAVLHHFPSKKALESAVRDDVLRRVFDAVHIVSPSEPPLDAVVNRFKEYATLLRSQPYLADYIRRVYAEGGEESIEFFRLMLDAVRAELSARIAAGNAREFDDPDVGLALYCHLVSAQVLIRPQLEAVTGLDLDDPNDVERLNRAQTDLLTRPLFSPAPQQPPRRSRKRG
jgi:AcrR family transcriptional regulator